MDLMHNSNRTMKITLENNTIDRKIVAAAWTKDFVASQENTACTYAWAMGPSLLLFNMVLPSPDYCQLVDVYDERHGEDHHGKLRISAEDA